MSAAAQPDASADDLVWAEQNTNPDRIESALRELLRERHAANPGLAPARVLNLVVVLDRSWKGEIANRLEHVGRYHASRTVLCAVEDGRQELDARAAMSSGERTPAGLGVLHETVEIDLGPSHLEHLETVVDPVVVSELPTVLWCPHGHEQAVRALLGMVDVMLLDSDDLLEPAPAFTLTGELARSAYIVDLAWMRTTPWRERLAASFDPPGRQAKLPHLNGLSVRYRQSSAASALLLAGWLASRLGWAPRRLETSDGVAFGGTVHREGGEVEIKLEPVDQEAPGLAGVTVCCNDHFALSLDRAQGGLCAREASGDGERVWQVLGASRGEGGILGEGVRQALLRDPTYRPALAAALRLSS